MRPLTRLLQWVRRRYHPLWRLRRSAAYPWIERALNRTMLRRINGIPHPVALQSLRDFSWWVGGATLEPETRLFLQRLLQARQFKVFWDVGANIGFISWFVRSMQPDIELVLLEPDTLNASLIRLTVQSNHLTKVSLIEAAISHAEGTMTFVRDRVSGATGHLEEVDTAGDLATIQGSYAVQNTEKVRVECRTLDGMVSSGVAAPDLIKIDVELAEYLVVQGGEQLFARKATMVLIEICDGRVLEFFARHGYDVWMIEEPALNYFAAPCGAFADTELMAPYRKVSN